METYFDRYVMAGGVMMLFLIPTAFLAIAFIVQGFINLRRGRVIPPALLDRARALKTPQERGDFVALLERSGAALARCVAKILQRRPAPESRRKNTSPEDADLLTDVIEEEVARLYHQNSQLAVIYPVAPLMGLLGTILGMMKAFYQFSILKEHSIDQLSRGINEALITTMWGLFIAIPAFIFLSIFRQRLYRYEAELLPGAVREIMRAVDSAEAQAGPERLEQTPEEHVTGAADDAS